VLELLHRLGQRHVRQRGGQNAEEVAEGDGVQFAGLIAVEEWRFRRLFQLVFERLTALGHLVNDAIDVQVVPLIDLQQTQRVPPLSIVLHVIEGPGKNDSVPGRCDLFVDAFVLEANVQLSHGEDVLHQRHIGAHVGLLVLVLPAANGQFLLLHKVHDRLEFGKDECSCADEGQLGHPAARRHVLRVGTGPNQKGEVAHLQVSLHSKATGVFRQ